MIQISKLNIVTDQFLAHFFEKRCFMYGQICTLNVTYILRIIMYDTYNPSKHVRISINTNKC